jgi:hypothetical protein
VATALAYRHFGAVWREQPDAESAQPSLFAPDADLP